MAVKMPKTYWECQYRGGMVTKEQLQALAAAGGITEEEYEQIVGEE